MEKNVVYFYRVSSDTGFAPCVDNGVLSLACCKGGRKPRKKGSPWSQTGIRYWIGSLAEKGEYNLGKDHIYLFGIKQNKLLYIARVNEAISMEQYFSNPKFQTRTDCIYRIDPSSMKPERNERIPWVHPKKDSSFICRDFSGKYALLSNKDSYIYFGRNAIELPDWVKKYRLPKGQETRIIGGSDGDDLQKMISAFLNENLPYENGKPHSPICESPKCGGCSKKRLPTKGGCKACQSN